jgi:hypothetical protein
MLGSPAEFKMNHRITRLFIAISFIALATACIGNDPNKTAREAMNKTDPSICEKISDYRMRYNCSMVIAVGQDNTTMCANIQSEDWKNDCLGAIAAKRRDISVCNQIKSDTQRDICYRKAAKG